VQTLELVLAGLVGGRVSHLHNRGHGVGVVGGKLGVDGVGRGQQLACTGQVGGIGVGLAGVDRVAVESVQLGAFDFAVPVGAFDQPHHQPVAAAPGQVDQKINHGGATLLVSLHHEADALKPREIGFHAQLVQQVERKLQPVGLLGVDVQADLVALGQSHQIEQDRVQLLHHPVVLRAAVARVQGRQLDGDAGAVDHASPSRCLSNGMDGLFVGLPIATGVIGSEGGLAQHVVGVAKALCLTRGRPLQGLGDGFPHHELLTHDPHGHVHAFANQRLPAFAQQAAQPLFQARLAVGGHQFARQQQAPGGGIDKE